MNHDQIAACVRIIVKPELSDDMLDLLNRIAELAARDEGTEIWAVHRGRKGSGSSSSTSFSGTGRPSSCTSATRR